MKTASLVCLLALVSGCASSPRIAPAFTTGDRAIAQHWNNPQYNGTQVTVTGDLRWRWIRVDPSLPFYSLKTYEVMTVDGEKFAAQQFQLRKITE